MPLDNSDERKAYYLQHHDYVFIMTMMAKLKNEVIPCINDIEPEDLTADEKRLLNELKEAEKEISHMIWKCNTILKKMENRKRLIDAGVIVKR